MGVHLEDDGLRVLVEDRVADAWGQKALPGPDYERFDLHDGAPDVRQAGTVVWLWADPLGLSARRLERALREQARAVWILNGRGRLFRLDDRMLRRLRWHRLLASSRLPELVAGALVWPVAFVLACIDYVSRRPGAR